MGLSRFEGKLNLVLSPRCPQYRCRKNINFCSQKKKLKLKIQGSRLLKSQPQAASSSSPFTSSGAEYSGIFFFYYYLYFIYYAESSFIIIHKPDLAPNGNKRKTFKIDCPFKG